MIAPASCRGDISIEPLCINISEVYKIFLCGEKK